MKTILMGMPGAGKGSLAALLKDELKVPHVSTGDMLRAEMGSGSELGANIKGIIDKGELVPDDLMTQLVEAKMFNDPEMANGYILDGIPRTLQQAKDLTAIYEKNSTALDYAIYMTVDINLIVFRLTQRRMCRQCGTIYHLTNHPPKQEGVCDQCGCTELYQRSDDKEDTIRHRLDVYKNSTDPIIDYYKQRGSLVTLDGNEDTDILCNEFMALVNEDQK